jgi:predicted anti-sigma-YlaC factor YlaD
MRLSLFLPVGFIVEAVYVAYIVKLDEFHNNSSPVGKLREPGAGYRPPFSPRALASSVSYTVGSFTD